MPRYTWEVPERRRTAVWSHDWGAAPAFAAVQHRPLAARLAARLGLRSAQ